MERVSEMTGHYEKPADPLVDCWTVGDMLDQIDAEHDDDRTRLLREIGLLGLGERVAARCEVHGLPMTPDGHTLVCPQCAHQLDEQCMLVAQLDADLKQAIATAKQHRLAVSWILDVVSAIRDDLDEQQHDGHVSCTPAGCVLR